jgi:hypothetical protein
MENAISKKFGRSVLAVVVGWIPEITGPIFKK